MTYANFLDSLLYISCCEVRTHGYFQWNFLFQNRVDTCKSHLLNAVTHFHTSTNSYYRYALFFGTSQNACGGLAFGGLEVNLTFSRNDKVCTLYCLIKTNGI